MLGSLAFMLVIEAILLPVFAVMLDLPTLSPALGLIILLATVGFATVGTFFASIAVQTRSAGDPAADTVFPGGGARDHRGG